jgi:hypothetical protein
MKPVLRLRLSTAAVISTLSLFGAAPAQSQIFLGEPVRTVGRGTWLFDIAPRYAQPVGAFRANVSAAWGAGVAIRHHFSWFEPLGLRGDVSILNYGMERQRVPLSSTVNRVLVDMRTSNNIVLFGGGPELMVPSGPVRPYVFGFVGYSYFYTQSSVGDDSDNGSFASTTNFDDGGLATGYGGGLRIPLSSRRMSVAIDAGAQIVRNGTRTYLRRGDVIDQPDGSLSFNARTTEADFWQYHIGVSFSPSRSRR